MDFNEELSAFDADAMDRQVESTRWVLEEYFGSRIFAMTTMVKSIRGMSSWLVTQWAG